MRAMPQKQDGFVLLIGLIFLVLLTLMGVSVFNLGKSGFVATANMQMRKESARAAEQVLDEMIDNTSIDLTRGNDIFGLGSNVRQIDINGDGSAEVKVTVTAPVCKQVQTIKTSSLDFTKADDLGCVRSVEQASQGIENANTGDSLCADTVWDVRATATETFSLASVTEVQGIGLRVATGNVMTTCY